MLQSLLPRKQLHISIKVHLPSYSYEDCLFCHCHGPVRARVQGGEDGAVADGGGWHSPYGSGGMTWGGGQGSRGSLGPWKNRQGGRKVAGRRSEGGGEGKGRQRNRGVTEHWRQATAFSARSPSAENGEEEESVQGGPSTREECTPPLLTRLTRGIALREMP